MKTSDSSRVWKTEPDNGDEQEDGEGELFRLGEGEEDEVEARQFLAQTEENIRFVSEVADNIAQLTLLARIKLDMLTSDGLFEGHALTLHQVREVLDQAITEIRALVSRFSPFLLAELGLESSLRHLCRELEEKSGVRVLFGDDGQEKPLEGLSRTIVYHAARETLFTVVHEGITTEVRLSVARVGDLLQLVIEDRGGGYEYAETAVRFRKTEGKVMCCCIRLLGGNVRFLSLPGQRAGLRIRVPLAMLKGGAEPRDADG